MSPLVLVALLAQIPVLPPEPVTAIVNGTIHPVSGPTLRRGTLLVRGSRIEAIGAELPVPAGARVIDAAGKHVCPGFVAIEASGVGAAGFDGNLADNLDPYQLALRVALAHGITTANVVDTPFFGFFGDELDSLSGSSSAVIKLTAGDLKPMLVREPGLNYFAVPTRQVELNLFRMRESFRRAAQHLRAVREAAEKKAQAPRAPPELSQYITILENERPTVVAARTEPEIEAILDIARQYPFDLILSRPEGGASLATRLAALQVPVLLKTRGQDFDFDLTTPPVDDLGLIPVRLPAHFAARGCSIAVLPYRRGVSLDGLAGRDLTALPMEAAFAVRGGLDEDSALRAITLAPAQLLRLGGRIGSLEKGKDADFLILTRHPLDFRALVEKAFINGKLYYEREKATFLRHLDPR